MSIDLPTGKAAPFVPPTSPRWPGWARIVVTEIGFFGVALLPTVVVGVALGPLIGDSSQNWPVLVQTTLQMVIHAFSLGLCLLLLWAMSRFVDRRPLAASAIRFDRRTLPALGLGLVLAMSVSGGLAALATQAGLGRNITTTTLDDFLVRLPIIIGLAFFLQGIPEELTYRGYMMATLWRHPRVAFTVSVLVFGAGHIISQGNQQNLLERFLYLGPATAFAFAAAALLLLTRSIWAAAGIHAGSHLGRSIAELAGVAEGPDIWMIETVAFVVIGIVALVLAKRAGMAPEFFGTAPARNPQTTTV